MARTDGAVQVRELRLDEALQPAGTVAPVFVPGAVKKPSTALADLSRLIGNFKGYMEGEEEKRKKEQETQEKAGWLMLSEAEKARRLAEGNVPPTIRKGFADADYGASTGNTFVSGFQQALDSEYDPEKHGTRYNFWQQKRRELAAAMPTPESRVAFFAATDAPNKKFEMEDSNLRNQEDAIARVNQGFNSMEAVYNSAKEGGASGPQAVQSIYQWTNEQIAAGVYDKKTANFMLLEVAKAAAERGETETVLALRDMPRATKDGPITLGNIIQGQLVDGGQVVSFRDELDKLVSVSERNRSSKRSGEEVERQLQYDGWETKGQVDQLKTEMKRFTDSPDLDPDGNRRVELLGRIRQAEQNRLKIEADATAKANHAAGLNQLKGRIRSGIENGDFTRLLGRDEMIVSDKPGGQPKTITDEDRRNMAIEVVDEIVAEEANRRETAGQPMSQVEMIQMRVGLLGPNNIVDPFIKSQLNTIGSRAANWKQGEVGANDVADAEMYWMISRLHPNAVDDYVSDERSKVFLEHYVAARENQYDEQQAAFAAASAVQQTMQGLNSKAVSMQDVEKYYEDNSIDTGEIGGAKEGMFGRNLDEDVVLSGQNYAMLRRQADFFYRNNIAKTPTEAIEMAQKRMNETHVNINGRLVYVGGTINPNDAREMIDQKLKQVFDENQGGVGGWDMDRKDYNDRVEDLTLVPVANGVGKYYVVNKNTFNLVQSKQGGPAIVTVDELRQMKAKQVEMEQLATDEKILADQWEQKHGLTWRQELGLSTAGSGGVNSQRSLKVYPSNIPGSVKADQEFVVAVNWTEREFNMEPGSLWAVIDFETGGTFDPAQKNLGGSSGTGLIQFMGDTAKSLGTSTEALSKMGRTEQMRYVARYLNQFKDKLGDNPDVGDVYMAVLWPKAIGKRDSYVLWHKGTDAYKANAKLDKDGKGYVTKGDAVSFVESRRERQNKKNDKPHVYGNLPDEERGQFEQWNSDPVGNHQKNLDELPNRVLANIITRATELAGDDVKFVIGSGKRTPELQKKAVEWGWSKTMDSDHLEGDAVDLWPLDDQGRVIFDRRKQEKIALYMYKAAEEYGVKLDWGGKWKRFADLPHFGIK